jgi:hypothetical protein
VRQAAAQHSNATTLRERVDVGFEDQWIDDSSMADRDPTFTVDKNGQRHFSQMAWINKRPTTGITAQVTP